MRILITNLLAVTALLFSAVSASAFYNVSMSTRPGTNDLSAPLATSDTVTVDIFFGTDQPGMQLLAIGVVTPDFLTYDSAASTALPVIYPAPAPAYGTTGAQSGYMLYYSFGKTGAALYAVGAPIPWAAPDPGTHKTNVNFSVNSLATPTNGTGSNIWAASLVFHVDAASSAGASGAALTPGTYDISLQMSGLGSVIRSNDVTISDDLVGNGVEVSAPLSFTIVPEPTTAAMIGLGILGLAFAGRRK